jgi:ribosomal protein S18 acetylase RimI-like enzyme
MVEFVPYDDSKYQKQFFDLNVEYLNFIRSAAIKALGTTSLPEDFRQYVERVFPTFTAIKASEGIIYLLVSEDRVVGMGAVRKLEDGAGEIKRMYIKPELQGKGLGKEMMGRLEEKARELGYSTLRLDTAWFLEAAVHVYRRAGFVEREKYSGTESEGDSNYIYMEKMLK